MLVAPTVIVDPAVAIVVVIAVAGALDAAGLGGLADVQGAGDGAVGGVDVQFVDVAAAIQLYGGVEFHLIGFRAVGDLYRGVLGAAFHSQFIHIGLHMEIAAAFQYHLAGGHGEVDGVGFAVCVHRDGVQRTLEAAAGNGAGVMEDHVAHAGVLLQNHLGVAALDDNGPLHGHIIQGNGAGAFDDQVAGDGHAVQRIGVAAQLGRDGDVGHGAGDLVGFLGNGFITAGLAGGDVFGDSQAGAGDAGQAGAACGRAAG